MQWRRLFPRSSCPALLVFVVAGCVGSAYAGGPSITLQPVPPKTVPPSDYPPGSTIVGQELILGSVPARVWLEIQVTGFPTTGAPNCLKTVQAAIDAQDYDMDGGGFSGSNADCLGSPANGGDLRWAVQTCPSANAAGNLVCRQTMSGLTSNCFAGEPNPCVDLDPGPGGSPNCLNVFLDQCDPEWICAGFDFIAGCDHDRDRCGATVNDDPSICMNDFSPSYLFTLVLDIPANAKGSYTLDLNESESFMLNGNTAPDNVIRLESFYPAVITIPCGRCCYGIGSENTQCVEAVSANECALEAPSAVFQANVDCPENGGPACPLCALDEHCDDGLYCNGPEACEASGLCGPGEPPCEVYEACEESTDSCTPRIPTVNVWGMITLAVSLLIAAKLRYRQATSANGNSA